MGKYISGMWYPDEQTERGPDGEWRVKSGLRKRGSKPPVETMTKEAKAEKPKPPAEPDPKPIPLAEDVTPKKSDRAKAKADDKKADAK